MKGSDFSSQSTPASLRFPLICAISFAQLILFCPSWKDGKVSRISLMRVKNFYNFVDVLPLHSIVLPSQGVKVLGEKRPKHVGLFLRVQTHPVHLRHAKLKWKNENGKMEKAHLVHIADSHRGKVNLIEGPGGVINGDDRFLLRK